MEYIEKVVELLRLRKRKIPLVHHITNYVTANELANVTLAVGGSPIMANAIEEIQEIISLSDALVLNTGTINHINGSSMILAGKEANKKGIPVILDPVGVGATQFRRDLINQLLSELKIDIIKGNFGEIKSILGLNSSCRGVDSTDKEIDAPKYCMELACKYNVIVAMTGETDIITNGKEIISINNSTKRLTKITGTGCMIGSLIGVFSGLTHNYLISALAGTLVMAVAGEMAEENLKKDEGNGTFKVKLLDYISNINEDDLIKKGVLTYEVSL